MSTLASSSPGTLPLVQQGALFPVVVKGPQTQRQVVAMIDSGSTLTSVDQGTLLAVGAPVVGQTTIITPDGQYTSVSTYKATLATPNGFRLSDHLPSVLGDNLQGNVKCLIGRDILSLYSFVYDGQQGKWQLNTSSSLPSPSKFPLLGWFSLGIGGLGIGLSLWNFITTDLENEKILHLERKETKK